MTARPPEGFRPRTRPDGRDVEPGVPCPVQSVRCRFVSNLDIQPGRRVRKRLDQRQSTARRAHPGRAGRDEIGRLEVEDDAVPFQPGDGRRDGIGEFRNDIRVGDAQRSQNSRLVVKVAGKVCCHQRVQMMACVPCEMVLEIVGDRFF